MYYPAKFEPADEGGFVVSFRDIPEAITQGDTFEEALEEAADALLAAMEFYFEDKRSVPMPSAPEAGESYVALPPGTWAKILLLNEMISQKVKASDLARLLNTRPQDVNRLIDLHHQTKIDTLGLAMNRLGKRFVIDLAAA